MLYAKLRIRKSKGDKKMKKFFAIVALALLCVTTVKPTSAQAADPIVFADAAITVVDDMRNFDQVINLSWQCNWSLDKNAGITEQKEYAKFTLTEKSIVRIKMASQGGNGAWTDNWFRLYANSSMANPLTDNDISYGKGDDYFLLDKGTYYMECGTAFVTGAVSDHITKIMIGAIPVNKAVTISKTLNAKKTEVTLKVSQKFATDLDKVIMKEGKVDCIGLFDDVAEADADANGTATFKVVKNGWYTIQLTGKSQDAFNKDIIYYVNVKATGIKVPATKGEVYTKKNVKYKVLKNGKNQTGTVCVMGMDSDKKSVTIPNEVKLCDYTYKITKINAKAFYKKEKLKKVMMKATGITSFGKNAFKGIYKKATVVVPKAKYRAYSKKLKTAGIKAPMKIVKK